MEAQPDGVHQISADQIYREPARAVADAKRTLADGSSSTAQQAEALATLGRSAYYDNRMDDAVQLLQQALTLTENLTLQADIALILAPALSKEGKSSQALDLLALDEKELTVDQRGKANNQRGIIFTELGRLPEAVEAFEEARNVHRAGNDAAGEGRALVNMAAAASEIGDLDKAEAWYEEAWRLTTQTGQGVTSAIIEGNLGYVASRRGDFNAALAWYNRARASFSSFGGVDLLVAVLETDHATTLLDLGLNNDAFEAAEYARRSSASGSNRMLEVQALLLLGQAQLRLRHYRAAERTLGEVKKSTKELDLGPWHLRCDYLLYRLHAAEKVDSVTQSHDQILNLAQGLLNAAWFRESLQTVIIGALGALDLGDEVGAKNLLDWSSAIDPTLVDPLDREYIEALSAFIDGDADALAKALERGFVEMDRQQQLLGSAELQVRVGHRGRDLRALALRSPLTSNNPAEVLRAQERARCKRTNSGRSSSHTRTLRAQLRDVRVGIQEARLRGRPIDELFERITTLETELIASKQDSGATILETAFEAVALCAVATGTVVVNYLQSEGQLWAVRAADDLDLFNLGPVTPIERAARAQRAALRRMAHASQGAGLATRADEASDDLDRLLVAPLKLDEDKSLIIVPDLVLGGLCWAGLPTVGRGEFLVAPNAASLLGSPLQLNIQSVGLINGEGLRHADAELNDLSVVWSDHQPILVRNATINQANNVLANCDLVHVASHGTFRFDNPFFSSLEFQDGPLTLLDLEEFDRLPSLIVLASCDSAATKPIGTELFGPTEALLSLGVEAVVAPTIAVDDLASKRLTVDFHQELQSGSRLGAALCAARSRALSRHSLADTAAAHSFQVHGGRSAIEAPLIST